MVFSLSLCSACVGYHDKNYNNNKSWWIERRDRITHTCDVTCRLNVFSLVPFSVFFYSLSKSRWTFQSYLDLLSFVTCDVTRHCVRAIWLGHMLKHEHHSKIEWRERKRNWKVLWIKEHEQSNFMVCSFVIDMSNAIIMLDAEAAINTPRWLCRSQIAA